MRIASSLFTLAAALALAAPARADSFVLIVANNRSLRPQLPDLQFADDDGLRYYQLWEALLPGAHLALLAEPDAGTARANPSFARLGRAPTRGNLLAEVASLVEAVRQARAAKRPTTFYFLFAGHGDVEAGRGFLELADGRLGADELEALVTRIAADRSHLILDSCNSYFMVRPRKPGGRPLASATVADAVAGRSGVGAFLSTSSEQTVYEWSEIQSGIFSYLVRSGLMGGADADGDGRITYDELRGFVGVASASVPNPVVRPSVFARGPEGDGGAVLVDLRQSRARTLDLPEGRRLVIRDREGFRLAELHTEPGFAPRVRLWGGSDQAVEAVVPAASPTERPATVAYDVPEQGSAVLAALPPRAPPARGRGSDRMFQALFAEPWGPRALARAREQERASPAPVYGLSRSDGDRLRLHLDMIGGARRDDRLGAAFWEALAAAAFIGAGVSSREPVTAAVGGVFGAFALWNMFPTALEGVADRGRVAAGGGSDPASWLPPLARDLEAEAAGARRIRKWKAGGLALAVGFLAVAFAGNAFEAGLKAEDVAFMAGFAGFGGWAVWLFLQETTSERMTRTLLADPVWQGIAVAAAPTPGGFQLSLSKRF